MTASTSTKAGPSSNPVLVAVVDQTVQNATHETYTPVRLACPQNAEPKDYLLVTLPGNSQPRHLLEIQCLSESIPSAPKQYQSWFVGNRVVADGKLYVLSRVDPLFWVLPRSLSSISTQWQPMDQILPKCSTLNQVLDPKQLAHLCNSYEMDEDEIYYKFSKTKTLSWLTKKQQAVYAVLLKQLVQAQEREEQLSSRRGGAFAKDFNLTGNSTNNNKENAIPKLDPFTKAIPTQAQQESIQIVCNYLSKEWQTAFLEHSSQDATILQAPTQSDDSAKRFKVDDASTAPTAPSMEDLCTAAITPAPEKPPAPKLSFGQKQLLKVNKKGMKSMTSFFAVKKKA